MDRPVILLVEDEPAVRGLATVTLRQAGYHVVPADDGPAAVAAFRQAVGRVAAAVLDVNLPTASGWDVLAELRRDRPDLPVVITTGGADDDPSLDGSHQRPTAVLPKPYRPGDLVAVVGGLVAGD